MTGANTVPIAAAQAGPGSNGGAGALRRTVTWRASVMIAVAAGLQVTVLMGPMADALGNVHVLVWAVAALLGLLQCFLIAELARYAPHRAGGVATYPQEAFGRRTPWLAALSGWGYWFAWTPGIAVNLILAAEYLRTTLSLDIDPLPLSLAIGILLYALNALGLRHLVRVAAVLLVLAGVALLALLLAPVVQPSLFTPSEVWPPSLPDSAATGGAATLALLIKWMFVVTWSAYAAEMAASVVAELRNAAGVVLRAMVTAGVLCLAAFTLVPLVTTGIVGADGLGESPSTVFLAPAEAVFGSAGRVVIGVMLACVLILGAQAYIIASSRALYQMSRDGHLPKVLARLNRFGVPYLSVVCDSWVIAALLLVFGTAVVDVVAAANIGYLVVFVLVPASFLVVRYRRRAEGRPRYLGRGWTVVGALLLAVNASLLVVGSALWGAKVWVTGTVIMLLVFVPMGWRRWRDRVEAGRVVAAAGTAPPVPRPREPEPPVRDQAMVE